MGHEIDLNKYNIRTDLVLDSIIGNENNISHKVDNYGDISVTTVYIDDNNGKLINKKKGKYVTILFDDVTDSENRNNVEIVFKNELSKFIDKDIRSILIIGLGNNDSTPDSLGPKVVSKVMVTRHLFVLGEDVDNGIKEVSAFSPGVMASTGIETSDFINSLVKEVKPSLVLVVDALAAGSMERINKSIQITDTGIHPGSGVHNMRKEISFDTIGVPVIGIGVPTVVESSVIVYDTINYLFKHISYIKDNQGKNKLVFSRKNYLNKIKDRDLTYEEKKDILGLIGELSDDEKMNLINEVLTSVNYNFIVTPKEIDFVVDKLALLIANGINKSLHNI